MSDIQTFFLCRRGSEVGGGMYDVHLAPIVQLYPRDGKFPFCPKVRYVLAIRSEAIDYELDVSVKLEMLNDAMQPVGNADQLPTITLKRGKMVATVCDSLTLAFQEPGLHYLRLSVEGSDSPYVYAVMATRSGRVGY